MFRGYVLRYLAAIASGDTSPAGARARLPGAVRAIVRRLARAHVIAAGFETAHGADEPHVHRLAYLRAIGRPAIDPDATAAVEATFTQRDRRPEARAASSLVLGSLAIAALVFGAAAVAVMVSRPAPRPSPSTASIAAPPSDPLAEVLGPSEPLHPLTEVFRDRFPEYVIALDARSAGREPVAPDDVASARARVLDGLQRAEPALVPAMTGLLDASDAFSAHQGEHGDEAWTNSLVLFHDALAQHDVPFYVDAQLTEQVYGGRRRRVLFSTYQVLARHAFVARERPIVALELTRLDALSTGQSLLGYTRPEIRHALVLVDRIERFLVEQLLPSMHGVEESVFVRGYEDERDTHWVTPFEVRAHEDLRGEARALIERAGLAARALDALASAIVARRRAISEMSHGLRDRGIALIEPRAYDFDLARLAPYRDDATAPHLRAAREAQAELATEATRRVWDALLAGHVRSVAEHEVQHRLDYEDDRLVHVPPMLAELTGETESEDRVNRRAERANAELSAYLSQVGRRPELARTVLLHVASFAMSRDSWRMPEAYASIALFQALAAQAGIAHGPMIVDRRIARREIAEIYASLAERDGAAIAELARRTWAALYGGELSTITAAAP
jgi:hypothetical protein